MKRGRPGIDDITRAEIRRRYAEHEKLSVIAAAVGRAYSTVCKVISSGQRRERESDLYSTADALALATRAAELFGLTLEQLQRSPDRGHPQAGSALHHARAAAVAAMRVGERPIAWEVITDVLSPNGGQHARLTLQQLLRRERRAA